jgi:hypothetical protein
VRRKRLWRARRSASASRAIERRETPMNILTVNLLFSTIVFAIAA